MTLWASRIQLLLCILKDSTKTSEATRLLETVKKVKKQQIKSLPRSRLLQIVLNVLQYRLAIPLSPGGERASFSSSFYFSATAWKAGVYY